MGQSQRLPGRTGPGFWCGFARGLCPENHRPRSTRIQPAVRAVFEPIDLAFMDDIEAPCEVCGGSGFKPQVLKYTYQNKNIVEVLDLTTLEARSFFDQNDFATDFDLLIDLGLDYLKLGQRLNGFSGGERQRLKLTKEIDDEDNLIVLDEPSTGLHPFDTKKLMSILNKLVNQNNTIIVIEHNLDIISQADWIIDVGEGAGKYGGEVIFEGTVEQLLNYKKSATAEYLREYLGEKTAGNNVYKK